MASSSLEMINVLHSSRVAPPPGMVHENSLPLTFFDLPWLNSQPVQSLLFFEFPYSNTRFVETIIPSFKHSLSSALKYFYPLAGNLIFSSDITKPKICYKDGDSVLLVFAESNKDFNFFVGNHPRNASEFYPLAPELPAASVSLDNTFAAPLLAIQVTLFPNFGISVGFTFSHIVADGTTFSQFVHLWALINKLGENVTVLQDSSLPFYDRAVVKEPIGIEPILRDHMRKMKFEGHQPRPSTNNVLATFILDQNDIIRLKRWIAVKCPTLSHISSFTVTCAYVWTCMVKTRVKCGENVGENEWNHFGFGGDCRTHFDPPIPANYFGNCLAPCLITLKSAELIGEDGFIIAANAIGRAIQEQLRTNEGIFKGLVKWISIYEFANPEQIFGVSGSPKFSCYDIDFGLGRPLKEEMLSITTTKSISLNEGKNNKKDIEIGLSFPKVKMDIFTSIFINDLQMYN